MSLLRLLLLLCWPGLVLADPSGVVRVIDGDTFDIGGERVRLFGVDAPEGAQTCTRGGAVWECGAWVTAEVRARISGRDAVCETLDTDRFGRTVARCAVAGRDLGDWLVSDGLAMAYRAYSWDYDLAEKAAQVAGIGIWQGEVQEPAEFRAEQAMGVAPEGCVIKGNISERGRIYHVPGQENYERTRIAPEQGERWFCSTAQAEAAGWRPAAR
jgi:endonuclease YncB( thermonuclease family)